MTSVMRVRIVKYFAVFDLSVDIMPIAIEHRYKNKEYLIILLQPESPTVESIDHSHWIITKSVLSKF